jgi:SAM-dependent methyltransferase
MPEWFEEWFGEEYLALYPDRDQTDAARLIGLLSRMLPWQQGWRVLDVACGAGRHAPPLIAHGARLVGIDLSMALLRRAREVTDSPVIRADMRALPIRPASFDLTLNLFTSFGYFATDEEHAAALGEMAATLRPLGWFTMDFLNAALVRERLIPASDLTLGSTTVAVTRSLSPDGRFVNKAMVMPDGRRFVERVRLFEPAEIERMFLHYGLAIRHRLGEYDGAEWAKHSSRTILIGQKA